MVLICYVRVPSGMKSVISLEMKRVASQGRLFHFVDVVMHKQQQHTLIVAMVRRNEGFLFLEDILVSIMNLVLNLDLLSCRISGLSIYG